MENEESQIRQEPLLPLEMRILRLADLLSEGDEDLDRDGVCGELESAGIDPAAPTARFNAAAISFLVRAPDCHSPR